MATPTNAQLKEKIKKLTELMKLQGEKIAELNAAESNAAEAPICPIAHMFTNENIFALNDKPKYEIERIFYTYYRDRPKTVVIRAEDLVPVENLVEIDEELDVELYNIYVRDARRLQAHSEKELFAVKLTFTEY